MSAQALFQAARGRVDSWNWTSQHPIYRKSDLGRFDLLGMGSSNRLLLSIGQPDLALVSSLAYSAEVPLLLAVDDDQITLVDVLRWDEVPGDSPLAQTQLSESSIVEFMRWSAPDHAGKPGALASVPSTGGHKSLAAMLAKALAELRAADLNQQVLRDDNVDNRDVELMQTFHRILFIRFYEDQTGPVDRFSLEQLLGSEDIGSEVDRLIAKFRTRFDSTFFEAPAVKAADLPPSALRKVLRQTIEPWHQLNLDFSVTNPDFAGRLYQSYRQRTPTVGRTTSIPSTTMVRNRQARFGAYYTAPELAKFMAERALGNWLERNQPSCCAEITVVDPACGSGAFLLAALRVLQRWFEDNRSESVTASELAMCLVGVDIDAGSLQLARLRLLEHINVNDGPLPELRLFVGDALGIVSGESIDWAAVMPDRPPAVVLCNPPFGAQSKLAEATDERSRAERQRLYPHTHAHNSDLSFSFAELSVTLAGPAGATGIVLPRAAISGPSGRALRSHVSNRVASIIDLRAAHLFDADVQTCALILQKGPQTFDLYEIADSRDDPAAALSRSTLRVDTDLSPRILTEAKNWTAPALRLRGDGRPFRRDHVRLAAEDRLVSQGPQVGDLRRYSVAADETEVVDDGHVRVRDFVVPLRRAPLRPRPGELGPFKWTATERLVLPFDRPEELGPLVGPAAKLVASFGSLPKNPQPGHLGAAVGPKVVIRGFAREPASVADEHGAFVVTKGTGGGINVSGEGIHLRGTEALLNSSLYQWLLRSIGSPRKDETVELGAKNIEDIPWPSLVSDEWDSLGQLGSEVHQTFDIAESDERIFEYWTARRNLDAVVNDMLGVAPTILKRIELELIREG